MLKTSKLLLLGQKQMNVPCFWLNPSSLLFLLSFLFHLLRDAWSRLRQAVQLSCNCNCNVWCNHLAAVHPVETRFENIINDSQGRTVSVKVIFTTGRRWFPIVLHLQWQHIYVISEDLFHLIIGAKGIFGPFTIIFRANRQHHAFLTGQPLQTTPQLGPALATSCKRRGWGLTCMWRPSSRLRNLFTLHLINDLAIPCVKGTPKWMVKRLETCDTISYII